MRYSPLLLLIVTLSCENRSFESDKRQLIAKDEIRRKLHKARNFDIVAFRQDTLASYTGVNLQRPIQYSLDFSYTDSAGQLQQKKGVVLFTPDGKSVITSQIAE